VFSNANLTQIKGNFGHWLLVIGYDEWNIITLDPYRTTSGIMAVPNDLFVKAYLNSCLITVQGIPDYADRLFELRRVRNFIDRRIKILKVAT